MTGGHSVPKVEKPTTVSAPARPVPSLDMGVIDPLRWHGKTVPEREWLVQGMIPMRNVTLLSGHGGTGKSTLMLQLLACAAMGLPWLGVPTRQVKCAGVFCEDDHDELHRRMFAVLRHYDREFGDLEGLALLDRVDKYNALMGWRNKWEPGEEEPFFRDLLRTCLDRGIQFLVIDSLYNVFTGDKLSETHAFEFVSLLRMLAIRINGAVVLTFHPSQTGISTGSGEFGSVGWHNACRSRLYFTAPRRDDTDEPDAEMRELRAMKANYAGRADTLKLRWRDGAFERVDRPQGIFATIERRTVETVFLDCLDAIAKQGRWVSQSAGSPDFAPRVFSRMPQGKGWSKADLERAMQSLFASNRIKVGEVGRLANRMPRMGIVRAQAEGKTDVTEDVAIKDDGKPDGRSVDPFRIEGSGA